MSEKKHVPTPEDKPHRKALAVFRDSALERWPELKPLEKWRSEAWAQMKRGFQLFVILVALPLVCFSIYKTHDIDSSHAQSAMNATNNANSSEVSALKQKIVDVNGEKYILRGERDKAQIEAQNAENALAPWKQLANSQYGGDPVTKRLDLLFDRVAAMESRSPKFDILLNDTGVTNQQLVTLPVSRKIIITAINKGDDTATGVTIYFILPIAYSSNVDYSGWERYPGTLHDAGTTNNASGMTGWEVTAQNRTPAEFGFISPPFTILTNMPSSYIPAQISVFSDNSRRQAVLFYLLMPPQ